VYDCPECHLPVLLVRLLETGSVLALEPDPHPHGTVLPDPRGGPATVPTAAERALLPPGTELYRAHAVSCLPEQKPSPARRKQRKGA
jgi:hypothetical protein